MQKQEKKGYFSVMEWILWSASCIAIVCAFVCFDRSNVLTLIASLLGVTALIFYAKGHILGPVVMIAFCVLYAIISYSFAYYGEMLTYVGMALPMAVVGLVTWYKNPYEKGKAEVKVNRISAKECLVMGICTVAVTALFYFLLRALGTANVWVSTLSIATSFIPAYLTFRRSPYYALGYALNDVVLIVLWVLASVESRAYVAMVVCFVAFLANDVYGFISWRKRERRQMGETDGVQVRVEK